jgi:hypothetical protein
MSEPEPSFFYFNSLFCILKKPLLSHTCFYNMRCQISSEVFKIEILSMVFGNGCSLGFKFQRPLKNAIQDRWRRPVKNARKQLEPY